MVLSVMMLVTTVTIVVFGVMIVVDAAIVVCKFTFLILTHRFINGLCITQYHLNPHRRRTGNSADTHSPCDEYIDTCQSLKHTSMTIIVAEGLRRRGDMG